MKVLEAALVVGVVSLLGSVPRVQDEAAAESRLKNLGMAFAVYVADNDDVYPPMSSPNTANPRMRWADRLFPFAKNHMDFVNPNAPKEMWTRPFIEVYNIKDLWGGFGYNFQYLGNSREVAGNKSFPFGRPMAEMQDLPRTILLAETQGVRKDDGTVSGGVYTVDPPHPSKRGSGNAAGYYGQGENCGSGPMGCRSTPAEFKPGTTLVLTLDGKVSKLNRARIDDSNGDRMADNGWFNGSFSADESAR